MKRTAAGAAIIVAAGLALSACGSTALGTLQQLLRSVGTSSNVQVTLSGSFTGGGAAKAGPIVKAISLKVAIDHADGSNLSSSLTSSDVDVVMKVNGTKAVELRKVGANLYAWVDFGALSKIPGIPAKTADAFAAAGAVIGDKWYELSSGLLHSLLAKSNKAAALSVGYVKGLAGAAIVLGYVEHAHHASVSSGYRESGSLQSFDAGLYGALRVLDPSLTAPTGNVGTFSLTVKGSGSAATSIKVSVTAPNSHLGLATGTLNLGITHDGSTVGAPSHATMITPQLLEAFGVGSIVSSSSSSRTVAISGTPAR